MSAENVDKRETQSKLIDENNERDKSYGTEGAVILPVGEQQPNTGQDEETVVLEEKFKRNRSLLKKMRSYESKESHISFLNKIMSFIFDTIIGLIALLVTNIIQVACVVIGSIYVKDCPISPGIPIILIVNGSINVLICVMETIKRRINRNSGILKRYNILMNLLKCMAFITFLAWIVIVYDTDYPTFEDIDDQNYCNKTLFLFAFWLLNVYLILFVIVLFITCCCCCCLSKEAIDEVKGGD